MNVTAKELLVLQTTFDSDYRDGDNPVGRYVWSWSANPWEETSQSRSFGGVVTSLMKKGLLTQSGYGTDDAVVALTLDGYWALIKSWAGKYVGVLNPGADDEYVTERFDKLADAYKWSTPRKNADVMRVTADGTLTTEI